MTDIPERLRERAKAIELAFFKPDRIEHPEKRPSLVDLIATVLHEIEQAAEQRAWQDISTAPKDGTRFWGCVGDDAICMLWHSGFNAFVSDWRRMEMAHGVVFADTGRSYKDHSPTKHEPTAWMPRPAPPTTAEPAKGA